MKRGIFLAALVLAMVCRAAEVIPPAPDHYFNDYARVTGAGTAERLNAKLEDFEKQTSSQVIVAVYPKMESDSSVGDYCIRVFQKWGFGQKKQSNGAVLFVFINDRRMYIVTGYGLEGALPDGLCKRIIDTQITPFFKQGNYDAGLSGGVDAILAAARGEYKGDGTTLNQRQGGHQDASPGTSLLGLVFWLIVIALVLRLFGGSRGTVYSSGGFSNFAGGMLLGSLMNSGGGGGFSGGGGGGGGGGGWVTPGGGSTGGGGAGGSW